MNRPLTRCGSRVCTGCRVCGCKALGIPPQRLWVDIEPLGRITKGQQDIADAEHALMLAVADARTIGHSWVAIAKALGVTRQSAQKRWARKLSEMSS